MRGLKVTVNLRDSLYNFNFASHLQNLHILELEQNVPKFSN